MTTKTNRAIKTPAERMRGYRRRQRHKWQAVRIEIAAAEVDALVKRGYLDPKNRGDQTAIEEAATAFISDAVNGHRSLPECGLSKFPDRAGLAWCGDQPAS